jgi:chaperonin GroES
MLKPVGDYVLVELDDEARETPSGVLLPDCIGERNKPRAQWGVVVAAGPGRISRKGVRVPVEVKPGDHVCFDRFAGTEMTIEGERWVMIHTEELLAKAGASSCPTRERQ